MVTSVTFTGLLTLVIKEVIKEMVVDFVLPCRPSSSVWKTRLIKHFLLFTYHRS